MRHAVESCEYCGCEISITHDEDANDPRKDFDHPGTTMVCWHRRYSLGDVDGAKEYGEPRDFMVSLAKKADSELESIIERVDAVLDYYDDDSTYRKMSTDYLARRIDKALDRYAIIPLYLYDHSGITMSTGSFSDPWDSGQVGWMYMSLKDALENWMLGEDSGWETPIYYDHNKTTATLKERAVQLMEAEVKEYDMYLTGDVWCYDVELKDEDGNVIDSDSLCGCYGIDCCMQEAKRSAEYMTEKHAKDQEEIKKMMHE